MGHRKTSSEKGPPDPAAAPITRVKAGDSIARGRLLEKLGEAVSDGHLIDWETECRDTPGFEQRLKRLQQLEALGRAHRTIAASLTSGPEERAGLFRWGHLQALELVGEGGFGVVYRALDTRLQREVALKLHRIGPGSQKLSARRFLEEARSLARVRHSNVLVVHGADVHDGRAGFWTDFIHGETLAVRLDEEGPLSAEKATLVGVALCRALAAVHAAGLIHGDVKAANVMREEAGRILLMDFGAVSRAPLLDRLGSEQPATEALEAGFGTPLVLAPEILQGENPGPTSDLYSLGVLLYQLVTGFLPMTAESWTQLIERHQGGDRVPLRDRRHDLPVAFVQVVERSLEPEPPARYQSAGEMERALLAAMPSVMDPRDEPQTLRSLLHELGRIPEEMCRQIGREAARSLMRLHASGQRWGDFGLDHMLLRVDGGVELMRPPGARSVPELPDESESASQRADLHALGAVLLELATGVPVEAPFESPREIRTQASRSEAEHRVLERQVSPFFEQIVHQLLAGDKDGTIATAGDLFQVLTDGEKGVWWREHVRAARQAIRRPLRRMRIARETALQGRESELRQLRSAYDQAKGGEGRVVLLEGEAGIGKTRLVDELVGSLQREGEDLNFLFGFFPPGGAATAAGAFLTAYRDHLGEERLEETLEDYLAPAPLLVAAFAALLRGESGTPASSPLTKDSLQTAFVHVTQSLALERPTVVLIDDLHFAPAEGRSLFAALALAVPGHRILLIGGARPGLPEDWIAGIERQEHCSRLALTRLSPSDILRVLAEAFTSDVLAEALAPEMALRSDGNPLFLFENLRALQEAHYVRRDAEGHWTATGSLRDLCIPSSLRYLIQARFAGLDEEDKELLDVAGCCGFEFDPALVGEAVGLGALPALKRFALIEKRHRLIRASGRRYVFDHHQVQEALYDGLFEQLREQYHTALAKTLEAREQALAKEPRDLDGAVAVALCEHYLRGGRGPEGFRYLRAALDHLEGTYQNDAAVRLADRALDFGGLLAGRPRFEVLSRKSGRLELLGRPQDELATLEEMIRVADESADPNAQAEARGMLGWRYVRYSRNEEARPLLEEALRLARAHGNSSEESYAAGILGLLHYGMSRYDEAMTAYTRSLEVARHAGDRRGETKATGGLGAVFYAQGRYEEARLHFEQHLALSRETGHQIGEAVAIGNLGVLLFESGQHDEGLAHHRRHLALSRQIGFRQGEAIANANLGEGYTELGRGEEALGHLERFLSLSREIGYKLGEASAIAYLGNILLILGQYDEARTPFERGLGLSREIGSTNVEGDALFGLGAIADQCGDSHAAERQYKEALVLWERIEFRRGVSQVLVTLGDLLERSGRAAEARQHFVEGLSLARDLEFSNSIVRAAIHLAMLPGGDLREALEVFASNESRLGFVDRMRGRYLLWKATADRSHLAEARRLLLELRDHAPAYCRETMLERVPLYRDILAGAV